MKIALVPTGHEIRKLCQPLAILPEPFIAIAYGTDEFTFGLSTEEFDVLTGMSLRLMANIFVL